MAMVRRVKFMNKGNVYQRRCMFCHRPAGELYQANFSEGGPMYFLHPGACFNAARANYKQNLENGTIPTEVKNDEFPDQIAFSNEDNIIKDEG